MGDLRDYCGFKIVCLDCGRIIELKDYNNDILKMRYITVSPIKKVWSQKRRHSTPGLNK